MIDYSVIQGSLVIVGQTGVLITGRPGAGKSMAAVNLALSGSGIVCDELVKIHKSDGDIIIGEPVKSPSMIEVRGLGIFKLEDLFPSALKTSSAINLIVELQRYKSMRDLGRTNPEMDWADILGVNIPRFRAPLALGVAASSLIEVLVRNHRKNGFTQG